MKKSDLKKIKSGGKWTTLGAIAGVFSQLIIMLSLALFLEPMDVGLFSVFLFMLGLGITLLPLGNDFSFVQADRLSSGDIRRSVFLSCVIALLSAAVFYPATSLFSETGHRIVSTVIFGIFVGLAEAIFLLFSAALQRHLNYKAIEKSNILRQILTLVLSLLFLAISHRVEGAYAARLISNVIALGILWHPLWGAVEKGKPRQKIMTAVSRNMLAKNVLGHISRSAEVVAGSPQLGMQGLGIYDLGRRIVAQPRDFIGSILFKFSYPMFTKIVKIENITLRNRFLRRVYRNIIKTAAFVGFPVFAIAMLIADPMIVEVFGEEWKSAVYVVEIFSLTAFVQVLGNNIITAALTAVGGSSVVLKAEYMLLLPRLLAVFVASFYGPIAIALTMSFFILIKLGWMQWELNKLSALNFGLVVHASTPMFLSLLSGMVVGGFYKYQFSDAVGAICASVLFTIIYLLVLLKLQPRSANLVIGIFRKRIGKRKKSAT